MDVISRQPDGVAPGTLAGKSEGAIGGKRPQAAAASCGTGVGPALFRPFYGPEEILKFP